MIASCAKPEPEVVVKTEFVKQDVAIVGRPNPISLSDPEFFVVNAKNYDQFIEEFRAKNGTETFIVISVKDYERLAINISELKRYIEQQDEIIVYYENALQ